MSFFETQISDRVALGFQAIPTYDTRVIPLDNGKEKRNVNRTRAKRRYSALYQNFTPAQFADILAVFHVVRGMAHSFRFKDWTDFQVENGSLGVAPSGTTAVQLVKLYTFGGTTVTRTITKPRSSGFVLRQAGVIKAGTLDTTTGLFTPSTAWTPGEALTASFEFDVPVRFASDDFPAAWENKQAISTPCELVEDFL